MARSRQSRKRRENRDDEGVRPVESFAFADGSEDMDALLAGQFAARQDSGTSRSSFSFSSTSSLERLFTEQLAYSSALAANDNRSKSSNAHSDDFGRQFFGGGGGGGNNGNQGGAPPTVVPLNQRVVSNETLHSTQFVSITDDDGDPITRVQIRLFGNGRGGYLYEGNARLETKKVHTFRGNEWNDVEFQALLRGRREYLNRMRVRAHDGTSWSGWEEVRLTTTFNANRPRIHTPAIVQIEAGETVQATDLITFFDEDRNTAKIYRFLDKTPGNGQFLFNGKVRTGTISVRASEVHKLTYRGAEANAFDQLEAWAYDGKFWSPRKKFRVESIGRPILETSDNFVLNEQERVTLNRLITKADTGPAHTQVQFYDATTDARSGRFYDGLDYFAPRQVHTVDVSRLKEIEFEGGKWEQESFDDLYFRAHNGDRWGKWTRMSVHTQPQMIDAMATTSWLEYEGSRDPLILTYSFLIEPPDYYDAGEQETQRFLQLTNPLRTAARQALRRYEEVLNVRFVEVPDVQRGTITFGMADGPDNAIAWAYFPNLPETEERDRAGDVWYNWWDFPGVWLSPGPKGPGDFAFLVTLHELGHAMGLKHPYEGSIQSPPSINNWRNTVMIPQPHPLNNNLYSRTLMRNDIAALQSLYGANETFRRGNSLYTYARDEAILDMIWDTGGTDTIDVSNQAVRATIDIRQGRFSSVSRHFDPLAGGLVASRENLGIAYGVTIENVVGTAFGDTIYGNEVANHIQGGGGNDTIHGGQGVDELNGGDGSDNYVYWIGDDDDKINEQGLGRDTFQLHWIEEIDFEKLTFYRSGKDLVLELSLDGGKLNEGQVTFVNQVGSNRVESFQIYQNGSAFGRRVDLTSVFANATNEKRNFEITDVIGRFGYLAAPI